MMAETKEFFEGKDKVQIEMSQKILAQAFRDMANDQDALYMAYELMPIVEHAYDLNMITLNDYEELEEIIFG
jgi:hypothetical protein